MRKKIVSLVMVFCLMLSVMGGITSQAKCRSYKMMYRYSSGSKNFVWATDTLDTGNYSYGSYTMTGPNYFMLRPINEGAANYTESHLLEDVQGLSASDEFYYIFYLKEMGRTKKVLVKTKLMPVRRNDKTFYAIDGAPLMKFYAKVASREVQLYRNIDYIDKIYAFGCRSGERSSRRYFIMHPMGTSQLNFKNYIVL